MKITADAIVLWRDKVLLFHRDNIPRIALPDCWQPPGGHLEPGEDAVVAIGRELKEEVSYVPENLHCVGSFVLPGAEAGKDSWVKVFLFVARVSDEEAARFKHGKGEGQGIGFFGLSEFPGLKLTPMAFALSLLLQPASLDLTKILHQPSTC